jgi:hypothetical protein
MRALGECAKIVPEKYTVHPGTCVHVFFVDVLHCMTFKNVKPSQLCSIKLSNNNFVQQWL